MGSNENLVSGEFLMQVSLSALLQADDEQLLNTITMNLNEEKTNV